MANSDKVFPAAAGFDALTWYDTVSMSSETPSVALVFATALRLAQRAGESEIGIAILLAALDHEFTSNEVAGPATGPFLPVPHVDMPLSKDAAAAIAPLGDIFGIPADVLRNVLLAHTL